MMYNKYETISQFGLQSQASILTPQGSSYVLTTPSAAAVPSEIEDYCIIFVRRSSISQHNRI